MHDLPPRSTACINYINLIKNIEVPGTERDCEDCLIHSFHSIDDDIEAKGVQESYPGSHSQRGNIWTEFLIRCVHSLPGVTSAWEWRAELNFVSWSNTLLEHGFLTLATTLFPEVLLS